jgi:hypothetical protein
LARRPWVKPSVEVVGHLRELVQGAGKNGTNVDGDPQTMHKKGGG